MEMLPPLITTRRRLTSFVSTTIDVSCSANDQSSSKRRRMPIPDYQTLMLPLLKFAADGKEHHVREAVAALALQFSLTEEELKERLPSGVDAVFRNRVGWAGTYLKKAGLIEYPKRGFIQITQRGKVVIGQKPPKINVAFLKQFPEFIEFHGTKKISGENVVVEPPEDSSETPKELLESGCRKLRAQVESDLLANVKSCSPEFFENLVVQLLTTIGYGGSRADAGKAIGKSGDGGIDGVIKEDKLGLDLLYIQAKRWDNTTVGRPEIQKFVGALHGKKAKKGVFLTTSTFTKDALEYVEGIDTKVILIDGAKLAELMIDYEVGVSTESSYVVKRVDLDFFEDEVAGVTTEAAVSGH
jgi:restriction system protein